MSPRAMAWVVEAALAIGLLGVSVLAGGERSCEGGNDAYAVVGLAVIALGFAVPALVHRGAIQRILLGLLGAALQAGTWLAGFEVGHVRLLCKLW